MTDKQLDNRVKKLQGIEAQMKELEAQAEAIRAEIKADFMKLRCLLRMPQQSQIPLLVSA